MMETAKPTTRIQYGDYATQVAYLMDAYAAGFSAGSHAPAPADLTWSTPGRNEYVAVCYEHEVSPVQATLFWPIYLANEEFPPSLVSHPAWADPAHRREVRARVREAMQADGDM